MKRYFIALSILMIVPLCIMAQEEEVTISADRPGMATGVDVLGLGGVQWETGFQCDYAGNHSLTLPTTMFRFGIAPFAELRLQYDGALTEGSEIYTDKKIWEYEVCPITLGAKVKVFEGSEKQNLRWIPKTSLMVNLAIPSTRILAESMHVAPSVYLLFQNDVTDWFNIGYNVGAEWNGINEIPATFLAVCLGFSITDNLGAFIESYNYFTRLDKNETLAEANLDFGFNYLVHPRVQLDLYASFNCQDPTSYSNVGLGVAWLINGPKKK